MCGRVAITSLDEIASEFSITGTIPSLDSGPCYNVAPTELVPVIRPTRAGPWRLDLVRWGLIPSWARDPKIGSSMINARVETAAEKPAFRRAFEFRRCVVAVSGFYEWKRSATSKQPYYITRADGRPLPMAGLWEPWTSADGEVVETCAIITKPPLGPVADLHDRMPAILVNDNVSAWLDPRAKDLRALEHLLLAPSPDLVLVAVGRSVNSPLNKGPECIEPLQPEGPAQGRLL